MIVEALSGLDPEGAPFYRERASALRRSIQALHVEVSRQAETWSHRKIVTFHGSLFYFAQRYGLQVVGVVQPIPGSEPSAQHMQALRRRADRAAAGRALHRAAARVAARARHSRTTPGVTAHPIDALGGGPGAESYEEVVRGIARTLDGALR